MECRVEHASITTRHSVVERAFGDIRSSWKMFDSLKVRFGSVTSVICACIVLHNMTILDRGVDVRIVEPTVPIEMPPGAPAQMCCDSNDPSVVKQAMANANSLLADALWNCNGRP